MSKEKSWFTITKIDEKTYAIRELSHSEETNSYLLIGEEKCLLIDTGMGVENIYKEVRKLTSKEIITVITHAHRDHIGSNNFSDKLGIHQNERQWLTHFPLPIERVKNELLLTDKPFPTGFNIDDYALPTKEANFTLFDKQEIDLGNRNIKVILTPGHSPGSCSFYDEKTRYLFTGDLIYKGELDCYYPSTEPLIYRDSLNKLKDLDISFIFGGHHDIFLNKDLLIEACDAFDTLYSQNKLFHHDAIYYFKNLSIRL